MAEVAHAREFGVIGLGRIGGNLALHAIEKDMRVVCFARAGVPEHLTKAGAEEAKTLVDFRKMLAPPRVVFLYVPAGPTVDKVIGELADHLEPGDIIIDGGNSYWGDSIRRHERLRERGLQLLDVGTSGGIAGARSGACFMAGGEKEPIERVEPILRALAIENGYVHAGPPGAGHFVKLVHNGIEFGMLQAIGEGIDLLEHYHDRVDVADILSCWRHGSVIRSWLVDLMEKAYREEGGLKMGGLKIVPPHVEDTGEVNWLVTDAMQMETSIPVISASVMQLIATRDETRNWARAIAMMRHGFGGHPYGKDDSIAKERQTSRVGEFFRKGQD